MGHDEDQDEPQEPPSLPSRLLNLGDGAREVVDADEEVFILYTLHPAPAGRTGLGQVDSHHDVLAIRFDLDDDDMPEVESMAAAEASTRASSSSSKATKRTKGNSSSRGAAKTSAQASSSSRIEVIVNQDSTSLRSTSGDTGSVVWRSSVRLGACLARQVHKPPYGRPPLLNGSALADANILELGSGTGVLPAIMLPLLSRFGGAPDWVATDQEAMLPLLRKNMEQLTAKSLMGGSAGVAEVDWVDCANQLRSKTAYAGGIEAVKRRVMDAFPASTSSPDLIIAVDCVFNPSLFSPLIDTLDIFTEPDKTLVLVVIELRSSEATMTFLETWLEVVRGWKIWAIPSEQLSCGLDKGYVAWVGWKTTSHAES